MTLLDAYPLVALVADEPAADEVEELLRGGGARIVTVNLCEAIDVCLRVHLLRGAGVRAAIEPLFLVGGLTAVPSGTSEVWVAADLRARHYDRKKRALSLADCFLLAHGSGNGEAIATADPAVAEVARAEGVEVIALPDSTGTRP